MRGQRGVQSIVLRCFIAWLSLGGGFSIAAEPNAAPDAFPGDRAAVRYEFADPNGQVRIGARWWDAAANRWVLAPDASWHAEIPAGDARRRWIDVVAVRHADIPGRGRWAFVLDRGNGRQLGSAKLVAMSSWTGRAIDAWWFDAGHEVQPMSRLRDFVIDEDRGVAVIHDAGTEGLLIVDLWSRRTHRSLAGHVPASAELKIDAEHGWLSWQVPGEPVGGRVPWHAVRDRQLDAEVLAFLTEPVIETASATSTWDDPVAIEDSQEVSPNLVGEPGYQIARRWVRAGIARSFTADSGWSTLYREAARGATPQTSVARTAQEP
ncbi:MAG: hypothetical protein AAF916_02385 [Planctomycetota bacterium]